MKKFIFVGYLILFFGITIKAQQKPSVSSLQMIKELELSPQQRQAIKDSIIVFLQRERKNKLELRIKLLALLNARQQLRVRRWYLTHRH